MQTPPCGPNGLLPSGIHQATLKTVEEEFGIENLRRQALFKGFTEAAEHLFSVGVPAIYIGGSFTTSKEFPSDVDGVWVATGDVNFDKLLPMFYTGDIKAMKARFGVDLYSDFTVAESGHQILQFFQKTRDNEPRGILMLEINTYDQ